MTEAPRIRQPRQPVPQPSRRRLWRSAGIRLSASRPTERALFGAVYGGGIVACALSLGVSTVAFTTRFCHKGWLLAAPWVIHVLSALLVILTALIVRKTVRSRRAGNPPVLLKDVLFVQWPLYLFVAITVALGEGFGRSPAPLWQFGGIVVAGITMLILHRLRFHSWW